MAACEKFTFSSTAGPALDARLWRPEGTPRAVVQLVHGMAEHMDRYDPVARRLNRTGLAVVGHTHLGHGPRAQRQGYFADHDGWQHLIDDVHRLRGIAQEQFPGLPYLMLGHSMGSFVTRCYLQEHGEGLAGVMLSGTGHFDRKTVTAALAAANLVCLFGGARKPSALIDQLAFGGYNKPFAPCRTDFDWLSRAEAEVDKYVADPYCGFLFTGSGYRELFRGLKRLTDLEALRRMPPELPLLLISGDSDPVGGMGRGVEQVAREMRDAGMKHVEVRLYPGGRHEILNETNRDEVVRDVIIFVEQCLGGNA
ncbi:MAG: alpha/beta hydrolase [Eubacteriales bacterium]|nr:alpha/beta hydrolase [Eubacteriales bacterium]